MRIAVPVTLAAAVLLVVILSVGAGEERATMFRADPRHTGVVETRGVEAIGGVEWVMRTGGSVRSTPAVTVEAVYVGSSDGRLYALDRETGEVRWRFEADGPIDSSPAVVGDRVFAVSRRSTLFAVDRRHGAEAWRVESGEDHPFPWGHESGDVFTSSPTVVGGTVVFGAGDGDVVAVDTDDGTVRWRHATEGRVRSSPAVAEGRVYVGSADGSLYAIDLETGERVWRHDTEGRSLDSGEFGFDRRTITSSPAVVDGRVHVGARDGHEYAVDAETGERLWRYDHEISWAISSPAVVDGVVYGGSSDARFFHALDAATGDELWRFDGASVWTSPTVVGERVYFGTGAGRIHALNRRTGAEVWSHEVGRRVLSSPVVADGTVYVGDDGGRVWALRGAAGDPPVRAVFWDAGGDEEATFDRHEPLKELLDRRGYEVLDAAGLERFLEARIRDAAPSVVVFAAGYAPAWTHAPDGAPLMRGYLEAGGRIVWIGLPPGLWPANPETGQRAIEEIDRAATARLLGVDHGPANFDPLATWPTDAGRRRGLAGWWRSRWAADAEDVDVVLARDEFGNASAWIERYGDSDAGEFVRLDAGFFADPTTIGDPLEVVAMLAERVPPTAEAGPESR